MFVPLGQWIICTVIFTPAIGLNAGYCVSAMPPPTFLSQEQAWQFPAASSAWIKLWRWLNEKSQRRHVFVRSPDTVLTGSSHEENLKLKTHHWWNWPCVLRFLPQREDEKKKPVPWEPFSTRWFSAHLLGPHYTGTALWEGWETWPYFCCRGSKTRISVPAVTMHTWHGRRSWYPEKQSWAFSLFRLCLWTSWHFMTVKVYLDFGFRWDILDGGEGVFSFTLLTSQMCNTRSTKILMWMISYFFWGPLSCSIKITAVKKKLRVYLRRWRLPSCNWGTG